MGLKRPPERASQVFYNILKNTKTGVTIYHLCKIACDSDIDVHQYLRDKWDMEHNHKLCTPFNSITVSLLSRAISPLSVITFWSFALCLIVRS
jgi:hypothetical protein